MFLNDWEYTAHVTDDFDCFIGVAAVVSDWVAVLKVFEFGEDQKSIRSMLFVVSLMGRKVPCTRDRVQ